MNIGILDSGLGGLSVLHCASILAPDAKYMFYADEDHVPYGEKTPEQVKQYTKEAIDFIIAQGADAVIIACNTATSSLPMEVRNEYPVPIIGMEPALKEAIKLYGDQHKRILVAATEITIHGKKMEDLIEKYDLEHLADRIALPGLVRFAEDGKYDGQEVVEYLQTELSDLDLDSYSTVVLGCTHFGYFKNAFDKVFGREIHFVDGNHGTVKQALRKLGVECKDDIDNPSVEYDEEKIDIFFSGRHINTEADSDKAKARIRASFEQLNKVYAVK